MATNIGQVIIYPTGQNPYAAVRRIETISDLPRKQALERFRDTGELPAGYSFWDDREKCDIVDPAKLPEF